MKRIIICLCVTVVSTLFFAKMSYADEVSDLKEQLIAMQNQMNVMQENIKELEQKEKLRFEPETTVDPETTAKKVAELESEVTFLHEQHDSFLTRLDEKVELDIYATFEYENFKNTDSVFDARNVELLASAHLTDRLKFFAEIEFERVAKTSSGSRQVEVEVEQGWLEYSINEYFNPRFGVILVPFGKFNLEHFAPFRDLTDRPIAMRHVIPTVWAEAGAGFTGRAFLGEKPGSWLNGFSLDYQFFLINGLTNELTDTSIREARGSFNNDNNNNKAMGGRLGINPFTGAEIGLSGYFGDYDDNGHKINGFDIDWEFTRGPFELIGEYALFDLESGGVENDNTITVPESMRGIYIQTNYHFWFDYLNDTFLGRKFNDSTFTAVLRYDQARIDDDGDIGTGNNREKRLTIGLNYRPVETWVLKLDYQFNNGKMKFWNEAIMTGLYSQFQQHFNYWGNE